MKFQDITADSIQSGDRVELFVNWHTDQTIFEVLNTYEAGSMIGVTVAVSNFKRPVALRLVPSGIVRKVVG